MSTPIPPAIPGTATQNSQATMALVLGILGLICCNLLGPFAWIVANKELQGIDAGRLPESNRGMAQVAKILGIIGTIFLALVLLWVVLFGGLATLGALTGAANGM